MTSDSEPSVPRNGRPGARGRRPNRGWLWFFVVLIVLTVAATAILWVYNSQQQLTAEELAAARKLWDEKRPASYVMTYTKNGSSQGNSFFATFVVSVSKGQVRSVVMRQKVEENSRMKEVESKLPRRQYSQYDMGGVFSDLHGFLKVKAQATSQGRVYLTAQFDPADGHVLGYIYSNPAIPQRVQVTVEIERRPAGPKSTS